MNEPGPPPDPRTGRYDALTSVLRVDHMTAITLALLAVIVPAGPVADLLGVTALVGVVASAPLRVGWLAQRWLRRGDRLYGGLAVVLFLVPLVGFLISRTL